MKKINTFQFGTCFFTLLVSSFLGTGIYSLIKFSKVNSLLSVLGSFILGFILLYLFFSIFNYQKDMDLKSKMKLLFKKPFYLLFIFIICLCFFCAAVCFTYDINNFIISQFLSETPLIIIGLMFSLLVIYINSKGIEVITRVSTILFLINILLVLLAIIGQNGEFNLNNFKPILEDGFLDVFKGILYCICLSITPIYIMLIIPKNSIVANKKTDKRLILFYILGFMFFISITFFTIGVLGIDLASLYQYPAYMILKRISLFGFLDRIENFIIIQWIFQVFISVSLIVYFINKMTNIKSYIIMFSILILADLVFKNNTIFDNTAIIILPIISFIIIFIMIIIFLKIKRKTKLSKSKHI